MYRFTLCQINRPEADHGHVLTFLSLIPTVSMLWAKA